MNILITGKPGIGKTTLIKELIQKLGKKAGGFYTEEIRKNGVRTGFNIRTLDGKAGILSSVDIKSPHRVGKYKVNLSDFEKITLKAIKDALINSKIVIIDEIGPMELFSKEFKEIVLNALDSPSHVIATIKSKSSKFIDRVKSRRDIILYNLNEIEMSTVINNILLDVKGTE